MAEDVHIPVNRFKLMMQTALFSGLGITALLVSFYLADNTSVNPLIWQIPGGVLCFFGILAAAAKAKKRTDKVAGVSFTNEGILDTSSDISFGLIKWKDIISIDEESSLKNGLLIIQVRRQEQYVQNAKNSAIGRLLQQNIRKFGTPVVIDASILTSSIKELINTSVEQREKQR